ncbi:hypothetical protein E1B28_008819 [Marasmius oreades]|uniref:Uncharacterized protein n=1 Tax=Marasmius oreades TaxID=181124 RepID=A0A9P7RZT0_9AGAR|nr:uncharacterized protein E1B28_008819 [Marasmius oreades]KAG7092467.1 hypothetical protein E1B28_008819 [Marasmius oreades]
MTHRSPAKPGPSTSRPRDSGYGPNIRHRTPSPGRSAPRGRSPSRSSDPGRDRSRGVPMSNDRPEPPRRSSPHARKLSEFSSLSSASSTFKRPSTSPATAIERRNSDFSSLSDTNTGVGRSSDASMTSTIRRTSVESSFKVPPAPSQHASQPTPPTQPPEKITIPFKVTPSASKTPTAPQVSQLPPTLPSLITTGMTKVCEPKAELSREQKQKLWNQRVASLASYHKHKTEYRSLAERIRAVEMIFDSSKIRLPEKKRRDLEKLKKRFEDEKVMMDKSMSQLVEADSWPVGGGPKSEAEELKLKKEAEEVHILTDRARQLDISLKKMYSLVTDEGKEKVDEDEDVQMITDHQEGLSSRPLKRRRKLSTIGDHTEPDRPSMEDLEELENHLGRLDESVLGLEHQHYSKQSEIFDELVNLLDPSNQEYRGLLSPEASEMQANVDKMDVEIREVADETAKVLTASHNTDMEITRLNQELVKVQQDFIVMTQRMQEFEKQRENDHREIEALETALQMYKEHPPSPPASPFQPEHVLPMIEEPVTQAVRSAVQERGDALRAELEKTLEDRNEVLYQTVWDKLVITGRTVEVVMSRLQDPNRTGAA